MSGSMCGGVREAKYTVKDMCRAYQMGPVVECKHSDVRKFVSFTCDLHGFEPTATRKTARRVKQNASKQGSKTSTASKPASQQTKQGGRQTERQRQGEQKASKQAKEDARQWQQASQHEEPQGTRSKQQRQNPQQVATAKRRNSMWTTILIWEERPTSNSPSGCDQPKRFG